MIHTRRLPLTSVLRFGTLFLSIGALWALIVYALYAFAGLHFLRIPFLPLATIGTAVAFYVGFKNNASYDRFWEGRKIWGGVVNESRSWAMFVVSYVQPGDDSPQAVATRRRLVMRHVAWVNALRLQLRKTSRFFDRPARGTRIRLEKHAEHMRNDWDREVGPFLDPAEHAEISAMVNPATHLLRRQGEDLAALHSSGRMDLFHQIAMMEVVRELYALQGKCERIKKTPFPRQYAEYSRVFTRVFVLLVPFGMLDVFGDSIDVATSFGAELLPALPMVAASSLVAWVFVTMEVIGDASEDPFERSMNDVPMNAMARGIERDLRQMIGDTDLPPPEEPIDGLLY
ncbi:MAG: putative membrane protein [Myxococcota bacterium]|jgi:putative membrane protein